MFSAALCRGLIEARRCASRSSGWARRFPRLYAAASLKPVRGAGVGRGDVTFSAALCRGLIEARRRRRSRTNQTGFSAALCRGLIEA